MLKRLASHLYFWVLVGIALGGMIGFVHPDVGISMGHLGDAFIKILKMLIGPVIFCTIVLGICGAGDMKNVGRIGGKTLLYFEVVSTLALVIGLAVGNLLKPGTMMQIDPSSVTTSSKTLAEYSQRAAQQSTVDFFLHIIPKTFFDAFSGNGDLLQVLLVSVLFGYALNRLGKKGEAIRQIIEATSHVFFAMVNAVMKLAPIGACGAMAFTIGQYGAQSIGPLMYLILCFYLTCGLFVFVVLGILARMSGFSIIAFLRYISEELLTVLGTSSSESVLLPLMEKLEKLGCPRSVVGLVVPSGYSFNLDGTNIYLTMALLFVAQATGIDLTLGEQATILGMALFSSKGASGVSGAGFVTLAATLAVVPKVPVASLALILGIDRFLSEARALTNTIGNGIAALVISAWQGELDYEALNRELGKASLKKRGVLIPLHDSSMELSVATKKV